VQVIPAGRPVDGGPWVVESGGVTGRYGVLWGSLYFVYIPVDGLVYCTPLAFVGFFRRVGLVAGVCKSYRQVGPWTAVLG
jgi:hypothetical protein